MKKQEILSVLREKLTDVIDEIPNKYENKSEFNTEEIETESIPGFIPFTDGGTIVRWFEYQSVWAGTGHNLPTAPLQQELERQLELWNEDEIPGTMGDNYGPTLDNDDTIMVSIRAQYYTPSNERGRDGKHTIALSGDVNLESPYHRDGNLDDFIELIFTFDSLSELSERMDAELLKIVNWFNGANFEESIREMKIRRM